VPRTLAGRLVGQHRNSPAAYGNFSVAIFNRGQVVGRSQRPSRRLANAILSVIGHNFRLFLAWLRELLVLVANGNQRQLAFKSAS
jgi:hypothetical protein